MKQLSTVWFEPGLRHRAFRRHKLQGTSVEHFDKESKTRRGWFTDLEMTFLARPVDTRHHDQLAKGTKKDINIERRGELCDVKAMSLSIAVELFFACQLMMTLCVKTCELSFQDLKTVLQCPAVLVAYEGGSTRGRQDLSSSECI